MKKERDYKRIVESLEMTGFDFSKPINIIGDHYFDESESGPLIMIQGEGDVTLKAVLSLIDSLFQQEKGPFIADKTYIKIIDKIGSIIKADRGVEGQMNIEVVRDYINSFLEDKMYEQKDFKKLFDKEDSEDNHR